MCHRIVGIQLGDKLMQLLVTEKIKKLRSSSLIHLLKHIGRLGTSQNVKNRTTLLIVKEFYYFGDITAALLEQQDLKLTAISLIVIVNQNTGG